MAIAQIDQDPDEKQLLVLVGSLITTIREYNHQITGLLQLGQAENRSTAELLAEMIQKLGAGSKATASRLDSIRSELENTALADDIRVVRVRLRECADAVISEIDRERKCSASLISTLEQQLSGSGSPRKKSKTNALDPVTGLPSFNAASDALDQDTGRHNAYLVAVMADRVSAISSRWGFVVGDHVLCSVSARLRKALTANDRVYRRRGPALMAIVLRDNGIEGVRREIARIWNKTEDETISVGKVSVTVSISASWSVFALQPREGMERKLEMFLTGRRLKI